MRWAALGALSAALAVAAGAFGAHALRDRLAPAALAVFDTGVRYHLVHALALLALGLGGRRLEPVAARWVGILFTLGTVLFAGSLYALALGGPRALGAITPLGGVCFLAGWLLFAGALARAAPAVTLVLVTAALAPGCRAADPQAQAQSSGTSSTAAATTVSGPFARRAGLRLVKVADRLDSPVHLSAPAGDPRIFVVEQGGTIRIVQGGRVLPEPFLDLSGRLRSGGEQGLLSIAFHPRYASNGTFYVNYTDREGDTRVERYRVSRDDPDRGDPASARLVLRVEQPYSNHNGGHVFFGPDGMLYVGMGDGGSGGDPQNRAQNPRDLLGKLLRLDVDVEGDAPYAIPRDNPFAGRSERGRPEIWAVGLRNPWRCAIDPVDGLLYIADVGQNEWEEVHVAPATRAGINYGWRLMEGAHPYRPSGSMSGLALPAVEYSHRDGCSITGGLVYRGRDVPALVGRYVFSDYCQGWIRSFRYTGGRATELVEWTGLDVGAVTSFGSDAAGELYVMNASGQVYRFAAASAPGSPRSPTGG
jgi:uncharacterized membrane protein YgdD (TMEM256/DUF423 family)/glucose/arabinose dehydrogenase